ncbi:MAG: SDR family NAD(P)-dependent oxidoreductase [Clostridia bacterium]|nr:SDR family NAD(P)-dependent oxidoreductase [Clostridia bacterium]
MKNLFALTGKVAVVIGGSRGLGKGMARGLANAGATVVISSRGKEALMQAADELTAETGSTVEGIALDITSVAAINTNVKLFHTSATASYFFIFQISSLF